MSIKGYAASACRDEQAQDELRIKMFIRFWAKNETKYLKHTGKSALLPVFNTFEALNGGSRSPEFGRSLFHEFLGSRGVLYTSVPNTGE